jgi:hypothetical protein
MNRKRHNPIARNPVARNLLPRHKGGAHQTDQQPTRARAKELVTQEIRRIDEREARERPGRPHLPLAA